MKKLTAERCREKIEMWERLERNNSLATTSEDHLQAYRIALPILEQQERGDGWIEWKGNGPTIALLGKTVKVRYQDNDTDVGPSRHFYWGVNCGNPIIAYRIIPEREESCSN
jgi:hypothetical protein